MKRIFTILVVMILAAALFTGCTKNNGGADAPRTTQAPASTQPPTTLASVEPEEVSDDLFDFALLERLFSMSYADLCREEGKTVELKPSGGGYGCRFSKYGDVGFGFGGDGDSPLVRLGFKPSDNLMHKQSLTLGELKQWLDKNKVVYTVDPAIGPECYFVIGDYTFNTGIESEADTAAIIYFEVLSAKNKTSG